METPLEYFFDDGSHIIFNKYTIDHVGVIKNKKSGKVLQTRKGGEYNTCTVYEDSGKTRSIRVCRAIVSTFTGRPPTLKHTVDHIDTNYKNDTLSNLRWLCKKGQRNNQDRPETSKSAFFIVKDEVEKTANEWSELMKCGNQISDHSYTAKMIRYYAQNKQYGFSYKIYPDLPGEVWKEIFGSSTSRGRWEISNMNRVKYITKFAENVLSSDRLGLKNGYPKIGFGGRDWYCHVLSFKTFYNEEYANKNQNEIVMHDDDDKLDFRPHKLHLGTQLVNMISAHDNGKYRGTKSSRQGCVSYINGIYEKEHDSQSDAANYLKSIGFEKATNKGISRALKGKYKSYGRVWKLNT